MYYYFQKIKIRRGESYIKSSDWLVNKGATINPKNEKMLSVFNKFCIKL